MALKIIICVTGPGNTGKSCIIREFTARHLKYRKAKGDVLGIFRMPQLRYAVGVTGGGDNPEVIREGLVLDPLCSPQRFDCREPLARKYHPRGENLCEESKRQTSSRSNEEARRHT
jgi:hypothetical protein